MGGGCLGTKLPTYQPGSRSEEEMQVPAFLGGILQERRTNHPAPHSKASPPPNDTMLGTTAFIYSLCSTSDPNHSPQ